jgi:hypothetical protein
MIRTNDELLGQLGVLLELYGNQFFYPMKKYIPICAFLLLSGLLGSHQGYGQSNAVKVNILAPVVRTFSISYERKVSETGSAQLAFFYTGYSVSNTKFSGYGLTPEYRVYLSEAGAINGFYVAPFLRYTNFNLKDETSNDDATLSAFGGGVLIGRQWVFKERVTLDLFLGPKYMSSTLSGNSSNSSFKTDAFEGFGIRTGITLGVAF